MHGWMGKILSVDLSTSEISEFSTENYSEEYLGGRGIALRLYWENVKPETGAFDPENVLIFMTGPLVATGVHGGTRMAVVGKSPMTCPEQYCYGNMGGFFPPELKKAGYDGIVLSGRANRPVYLWVEDDITELRDASFLWRKGAYRVGEILNQKHGNKARFLTTGVAGENLVRSAIILGSHQSTSTGGFGSVMASKNLKAIVVKGTGKSSVADPDKLKDLNRYTLEMDKRIDMSIPPEVTMTGHGHLLEAIGKNNCYQCGLNCNRNRYRYGDRSDLEGVRRCQAMEYYLPWKYGQEEEPVETFFDAPALANDYSVCTFELRNMLNWLYACTQNQALSEEETGLPLSRMGTREFLEILLHSIAYRKGFGDILAEGLFRAVERVPEKAKQLLDPSVQPIGEVDANQPRLNIVHALLDPMEPRMSRPIAHAGFVRAALFFNMMDPGSNPITLEVFQEIAKTFWGSVESADGSSYDGKALAAVKIQDRVLMEDCLGLCDLGWPLAYSFSKQGGVGDPDLEAKIFAAVTGLNAEMIDACVKRVTLIQRAIQLREGRKVPEADFPAEINFTEPAKPMGHMVSSDPDDNSINPLGMILDRDKFSDMLREYYRLRGWNEETGQPLRETIAEMVLKD
jgi:aldehyde:ferredoxin oxidoreductase